MQFKTHKIISRVRTHVCTDVRENWRINLVEHSSRMNCRRIMTANKEWELFEEQNQLKKKKHERIQHTITTIKCVRVASGGSRHFHSPQIE